MGGLAQAVRYALRQLRKSRTARRAAGRSHSGIEKRVTAHKYPKPYLYAAQAEPCRKKFSTRYSSGSPADESDEGPTFRPTASAPEIFYRNTL